MTTSPHNAQCGPELPFGPADLESATKVVECLAQYPQLVSATWLRPLRKALHPLADMLTNRKVEGLEKSSGKALQQATAQLPSAIKSQIPLSLEDSADLSGAFPIGLFDVNGQQIDLRTRNSWVLRLGEIETTEIAEVFTINAMAPFIINNRLLPMLDRQESGGMAFIINVSAMEGKFYRNKKPTHPHTNMAKAALNMMTRTCAADLARRGIFMNSVDTGWINDENPLHVAHRAATEFGFQTPLDEIDAAARILDPIFATVKGADPVFGLFLKDYVETEW
ncbi:hypothetical protein ATCC90586_002525 [Pythium insidiosum]|nr:hypothetical protein ATCC90586_002525 [Pythium insidiosum]